MSLPVKKVIKTKKVIPTPPAVPTPSIPFPDPVPTPKAPTPTPTPTPVVPESKDSNFWEWTLYEVSGRHDKKGECSAPVITEDSSFWREFWPRCKNAPAILYGNPLGDIVVFGYKSRKTINEPVVHILRENDSSIDEGRFRGDLMVFKRTDGKVDGYPPEYLVRWEGDLDETTDLSQLLNREGIAGDRPSAHTFAYLRNRVRMMLFELLMDYEMARDAERGILEQTIRETFIHTTNRIWKDPIVKQIYKTTFARVWKNLLPSTHPESVKNPKLLANVRARLIPAEEIASLPPHKLWSEKWQELEETRILKQIATLEAGESEASTTDMFQCRKCKERKTRYYQMQTRSADEPMTTFIYCVVCGNRWKE